MAIGAIHENLIICISRKKTHIIEYKMMTEICLISIGTDKLENDFMFFTDGTVVHEYDLDEPFRTHVDTISVADIDGDAELNELYVVAYGISNDIPFLFFFNTTDTGWVINSGRMRLLWIMSRSTQSSLTWEKMQLSSLY
ncbi:MAG TPA: hypothetical protein VIU12_30165 [Chryseolinea sp.]